ncbi:encapsulin-associated ferritin-like protein [Hydrocarboniclastica marina]|uniref:Ferritin n=1 Tax=Hydrocarboniclastica marina TaxID=2259620 RepID=A0A4P7XHH7_9ALTE|nr:ferritin-like domain-containing protein [Hydrocarboniclastica marina]MAL99373.1 ferritin [Alteromonadaceae bacterium]QCF26113.1 ferritin [Hydrocarboniclastica marina]|tara:strand:+ start:1349 stop:1741 length:393 start_codon:yes stop_codon:yes gene_type:complete
MAGASESYHEPVEQLSPKTKDMHRALVSLQEELEAVDWYRQRADATDDQELKGLLLHNMREEVEHACMVLEWLRRNSEDFAEQLKLYLFTDDPILEVEESEEAQESVRPGGGKVSESQPLQFTIGDLKGK